MDKFDRIMNFMFKATQFIGFTAFNQQKLRQVEQQQQHQHPSTSSSLPVKLIQIFIVASLVFGEANFIWYTVVYAKYSSVRTATNLFLCTISIPLWFQVGHMFWQRDDYMYILEWCRRLYQRQQLRDADVIAHALFEKCHRFTFNMIR